MLGWIVLPLLTHLMTPPFTQSKRQSPNDGQQGLTLPLSSQPFALSNHTVYGFFSDTPGTLLTQGFCTLLTRGFGTGCPFCS